MSKINVLYSFPLRLGTIGTGMTAWHQVTGLLGQGVRVHLYAGSCEKDIHGLNSLRETLVPWGAKLPIKLLGVKRAAALHDMIVARALSRSHKRSRIEIVHCWPSGAKETLKVARDLAIKTVLERPNTHTLYAFDVVRQECEKLGIKLNRSHSHAFDLHRLSHEEEEFELADRLICPSEFVAKTFLNLGFRKEKMALCQYGFDTSRFGFPPINSVRNKEWPFSVAFLGSCEPRKGLHYALRAWTDSAAANKGSFYICGKFIPKYRELLADMLGHPSIQEIGYLDDVTTILHKCHALVLPSIEEGSAIVTYEARACACVLLVSEASGAHCRHMHDALIHKVGDMDSLRRHIDMLASDKALYARLQENSVAGLDNLTWERATETLLDIYRRLLNSTRSRNLLKNSG